MSKMHVGFYISSIEYVLNDSAKELNIQISLSQFPVTGNKRVALMAWEHF